MTKEEYIKKHGVSEKEFLYYCINCLNNKFMRDADDNVNDLKGFLYDLVLDYFKLKEKYSKLLDDVHDYRYETHAMKMTIRNLCEHFGVKDEKELQNIYLNKPYKFEDLHEGMWVYDSDYDVCRQIHKVYNNGSHNIVQFKSDHYPKLAKCYYFVENRFFPLTKANQGK